MRKRVLIIDDEQASRLIIRQYIQPYADYEVIGECDNGIDAVQLINDTQPDLIFLDVKMPGLNGFQVVQQLIHIPRIIFTTAYNHYALKAFESNAIDYLLKPYTSDRFKQSIMKLASFDLGKVQQLANDATGVKFFTRILVENSNKFINIATNDILYIEAEKDYARLHTQAKSYLSNYGIGILQQRMDPSYFIRVHRSYIVNINHIKEVHKEGSTARIIMSNDKSLNVTRTYIEDLKKLLY